MLSPRFFGLYKSPCASPGSQFAFTTKIAKQQHQAASRPYQQISMIRQRTVQLQIKALV
jgi:hypothetical protein